MCLKLTRCVAVLAFFLASPFAELAEYEFDLRSWQGIESRAAQNDARASGLRDGYLAGVRDALRF